MVGKDCAAPHYFSSEDDISLLCILQRLKNIEMTEILLHNLDKQNYFYKAITTLAFAQFGSNELFSRGFILYHRKQIPDFNNFVQYIESLPFPDEIKQELIDFKGFTPHTLVPGFLKKDKSLTYRMEPNISAYNFIAQERGEGSSARNISLTHMTIMAAWEQIITLGLPNTSILEFFRHIRNAAAHNGKFEFHNKVLDKTSGDLIKPAEWKTFKITSNLQGKHLIALTKLDTECFMDQGDIVEFLLEFESHYPQIKLPAI
jgi:hypothetical protein